MMIDGNWGRCRNGSAQQGNNSINRSSFRSEQLLQNLFLDMWEKVTEIGNWCSLRCLIVKVRLRENECSGLFNITAASDEHIFKNFSLNMWKKRLKLLDRTCLHLAFLAALSATSACTHSLKSIKASQKFTNQKARRRPPNLTFLGNLNQMIPVSSDLVLILLPPFVSSPQKKRLFWRLVWKAQKSL